MQTETTDIFDLLRDLEHEIERVENLLRHAEDQQRELKQSNVA